MKHFCAAVDWGTSRFRLWVLAEDGTVLAESKSDEGLLSSARVGFSNVLEKHLQDLGCNKRLPVIICGMAGSRQGWQEANYLNTPVLLEHLYEHAIRINDSVRDIRILPGVAQRDATQPDVMRGEETQLIGMLNHANYSNFSSGIVCMPGTHSKWLRIEERKLSEFSTYMTGELFSILSQHSVLRLADNTPFDSDGPAFHLAVSNAIADPQNISNLLFQVRSAQLLGYASSSNAMAALSGTLIGLELSGAFKTFNLVDPEAQTIHLLASGYLGKLYHHALVKLGFEIKFHDAENAGLEGMVAAASSLWGCAAQQKVKDNS